MTITKPSVGATGWNTATDAAIDILNLITPNGLVSDIQEIARDAVGSALVAGSGISIVVNDAADTITITNTGGGGGGAPSLPASVSASGAPNTFAAGTGTANVWFDLTTAPANVSFTNPSATYDLTVLITVGAWLITPTNGTDVRLGYRTTGAIVSAAGPGLSAISPPSWGHVPLNAITGGSVSFAATYSGVIPAGGTVDFISQSFFSNTAGVKACNYPGIQITPIHYNI